MRLTETFPMPAPDSNRTSAFAVGMRRKYVINRSAPWRAELERGTERKGGVLALARREVRAERDGGGEGAERAFFLTSRSMPTANAEAPRRSEGT